MLGFFYLQICMPCIIALVLIPVFCCCMPCLIRVLARMQPSRGEQKVSTQFSIAVLFYTYTKGATDSAIDLLPLITLREDSDGINSSCPICLSDMVVDEEARILSCKHMFHKQVRML